MDGSPEAAAGTRAWPSFRRANRPRRLNNPHSPRRPAAARTLPNSSSTLASGRTTPKRLLSLKRGGYDRRWRLLFPYEALEPAVRAADLRRDFGRDFRFFGLSGPPFGESLEPYLAPYGYLAVNDGKSGGVFRQECGLKVTVTGKNACQAVTVTEPLTMRGSLLKSRFRAGCTHFLRDQTRPRDPRTERSKT